MPELLGDDTVDAALAGTDWVRHGAEITRDARRDGFAGALDYVNQVGALAQAYDHHPDITLKWDTVTLVLSTHSSGGLTQKDLDLAAAIDALD